MPTEAVFGGALSERRGLQEGGEKNMWRWLQENHPVINEVVWWGVNAISIVAIIISIICIAGKG